MEKEELAFLKKDKGFTNKERLLYLRKLAKGEIQGPLTGYASVDLPWLVNYPEEIIGLQSPEMRIIDYLNQYIKSNESIVIHFYGKDISWKEVKDNAESIAKSLKALGVKKGDCVDHSLDSVPEYISLLLAAEMLGVNIRPTMDDVKSDIFIAEDYISQEQTEKLYNEFNVSHIVLVSPFNSADKNQIRPNIKEHVDSLYSDNLSNDSRNILWEDFIALGNGVDLVPEKYEKDRALLSAFTSGSTGEPKENIHTAESMLGIIDQLMIATPNIPIEMEITWLLTILPPSLIAVVVTMMLFPIASNKKLILDPYCIVTDLDIEMMHYRPNCWALIPYFFENLIKSKRIPADYDMSHLFLVGFGAEPMRLKFLKVGQKFLHAHNCFAPFGSGYGQSEGGSDFTISLIAGTFTPGSAGIPLIRTVIGIFKPNTIDELPYNTIGEVCKCGPGIMKQYRDPNRTKQALKYHEDGHLWLHTGDIGYITSWGEVFVLGRKELSIYSDVENEITEKRNCIYPLLVENKILELQDVDDVVMISKEDESHPGFDVPYIFIKKSENCIKSDEELFSEIMNQLDIYEQPKRILMMSEKPISHFKTDRKILMKTLNEVIN